MGAAVYVVLKDKEPEAEPIISRMSGEGLAEAIEPVDELASQLGLTPLMRFFSADPEELRGLMEEEEDDFEGDAEAERAEALLEKEEEARALAEDDPLAADETAYEPGLEEEDDGAGAFVEQWFDAAEGLETVRGLIEAIEDAPDGIPAPQRALADLRDIERVLSIAAEANIAFHVAMDF